MCRMLYSKTREVCPFLHGITRIRCLPTVGINAPKFIKPSGFFADSPGTLPSSKCHRALEAANMSNTFHLETHWQMLIIVRC